MHFVTDELDGGPVILRAKVPVFANDSEDDITARVQTQEHAIYPLVISWFAQGRLKMRDNAARLDGRRLPPQVMRLTNNTPSAGLCLLAGWRHKCLSGLLFSLPLCYQFIVIFFWRSWTLTRNARHNHQAVSRE